MFYFKCEYKFEYYFISYCSLMDMCIIIFFFFMMFRIVLGIGFCDNFKMISDISFNFYLMIDGYVFLNM